MKIELTKEQIELLTANESEKLQQVFVAEKKKMESKYNAELKALEKKLDNDLSKLADKFKYFNFEDTPIKPKVKIDKEIIRTMIDQKKSVKEIAEYFNTSESSIRSKLWNMKIKLTDSPQ